MEGIIKFQFVQKGKNDYVMNVVTEANRFNEMVLLETLHEILSKDAQIQIKQVTEIEQLSSGKTPYIINSYKPN